MKRRSVHRSAASWCLAAFGMVLLCLPAAGAASAPPPDSVHFCGVVDHEAWLREHPPPAGKVSAELNAGEPRTVRMIYFLPNDRPYRQSVVDSMKKVIVEAQTFFAGQMDAHGHGYMSFRYEAGADGEPLVHRLNGEHDNAHYLVSGSSFSEQTEVFRAYERKHHVYLIVIDNSIGALPYLSDSWARGYGSGGKNQGSAYVSAAFDLQLVAHELAHAFGMLWHDFRDNAYVLSYGGSLRNRLSACAAGYLAVSPFFNPAIPLESSGQPQVEFAGPWTRYPVGAERVALRLRVTDPEGIHQVRLFTLPRQGVRLTPQMKACRALAGQTEAVVTFDYDGVVPGIGGTSLSNPPARSMRAEATDRGGTDGVLWSFGIAQASPYLLARLGGRTESRTGSVTSVAISPDGGTLAYGMWEPAPKARGRVVLWDPIDEKEITRLKWQGDSPRTLAFSPGGSGLLAVGWDDGPVSSWDVTEEKEIAVLEGHGDLVHSVAFSPDGGLLASASYDGTARVWDVAARAETAVLEGTPSIHRYQVAFSPDGRTLAFAKKDTLMLWDVASRKAVAAIEEERWVSAAAFSPDGGLLALGLRGGTVVLRDVASGEKLATLAGHGLHVAALAFSPDGGLLASASWDHTVRLWDVIREEVAQTLWHSAGVTSIAFTPDGRRLAAAAHYVAELWDTSEWTGPRPSRLANLSGDGQEGAPGAALARSFVVEVRDQYGRLLPGATVTFTVTAGGGRLGGRFDVQRARTDTQGRAAVVLTLGPEPGANAVEVTMGGRVLTTFRAVGAGTRVAPVADDPHRWHLPAGAVARLGKGDLSEGAHAQDFSPDGRYLGLATGIGVWLYDVGAARFAALLPSVSPTGSVSFSPDGAVLAAAGTRSIALWHLESGTRIGVLERQGWHFPIAVFSPDGSTLASGQSDGSVVLWDVESRRETALPEGHTRPVRSLSFSRDGTLLASASEDSTVRLWDVSAKDEIAVLRGHGDRVSSVSFSPDGRLLASGSWDRTVRLWDVAGRRERDALTIHTRGVTTVAFSPGGGLLASGTWVGALKLWDVAAREEREALSVRGSVRSLAFSPDGTTLASGGSEAVVLHDVATGSTVTLPELDGFGAMAFSPDGMLASASFGSVTLWDLSSRSRLGVLEGHNPFVVSLAFSPGGATLASAGGWDPTVRLWDVSARKEAAALEGHRRPPVAFAFSPDGTTLTSAGDDGIVKVWDVVQQRAAATMTTGLDEIRTVALSPGGGLLAFGSRDGAIVLWDVAARTRIATLQGHTGNVRSVAFSSDGTLLASTGGDRRIILWDVAAAGEGATLARPREYTSSLVFSPDRAVLASGSVSGAIVLWDVAARKEIALLQGDNANVESLAFTPDGATLVSGSTDGAMLVWEMQRVLLRTHTLTQASGLEQTGPAGTALTKPFVVSVRDRDGRPVAGAVVTFAVTAGGGALSAVTDTTDANGRAATTLTLGTLPGRNTVVATVADLEPVAFTATALANADFDGDGVVGFTDFVRFAARFGLGHDDDGFDVRYDLDGNGSVGFSDFLILAKAFGQST